MSLVYNDYNLSGSGSAEHSADEASAILCCSRTYGTHIDVVPARLRHSCMLSRYGKYLDFLDSMFGKNGCHITKFSCRLIHEFLPVRKPYYSVACWNGTFHKPSNRRECFSASSRHDEESALFLSSSPREVKVFVQSIDSLLLMWHHQFSSICFGFRRKNRIIPFSRITHEKNTILSLFPRMKMFIYAILNVALVSSCP